MQSPSPILAASRRKPRTHQRFSPIGSDRRLFDAMPHACLLLDRDFSIVEVNGAYAELTMTDPDSILGRDMFDVFPDNPGDPEASGVTNLRTSLLQVKARGSRQVMPRQRYDIRNRAGVFVERHWDPMNYPLLDDNGEVEFIVHHVRDVTAEVAPWDGLDRSRQAIVRSAALLRRFSH